MRRLGNDEGATATFVALLLVLLLGISALVLDVGNMYWERRQLQNGADAGSLAVALDLAEEAAKDNSSPGAGELGEPYAGTAKSYADDNAADGTADIESLLLGSIESLPLTRAGEVTATTLVNDAGANELSHWFAQFLGIDSSVITAPASAIYGPLGAVDGAFPVVVCEDEYDSHDPGEVFDIPLKGTGNEPVETSCPTDPDDFPPGQVPGNFSWLTPDGEACTIDFDLDDPEMDGDTGVNVPSAACADEARSIEQAINAHKSNPANELPVRFIAVFSSVSGTGSGGTYTITKLAAFEFTGVKFTTTGGANVNTVVGGWIDAECVGGGMSKQCVQGSFTGAVSTGEIDFDADSDLLGVELSQ